MLSGEIGRLWLGALAAALVIPVLVLAFNAPLWLGAGAAFAVFLSALFLPAQFLPAQFLPAHEGKSIGAKPLIGFGRALERAQEPALRAALQSALPALARLERAAQAAEASLGQRLQRMVDVSRGLIAEIENEPARLAIVQRLLTYYLPSAADIAEGYARLRADGLAPRARLAGAESVLAQLEAAVAHFAARLQDQDLRALDAEIRLVAAALKDEIG